MGQKRKVAQAVGEASWLLRENRDFPLQNIAEPNLIRDQFPYSEPPRVIFDGYDVPLAPAGDIFITDTTFRDGQQARPPYSVAQVVDIYDMLHRLGGTRGVVRQCEFFLYTDKDRDAVQGCLERGYRFPEVTGWIRAVKKDFQLVKDMGLAETGILTSCSDYHIFLKLGWTRQQAMDNYLDVVRTALDAGIKPRCHFEDLTRADVYGFAIPFAIELMKLQEQSGIPIRIRLCDTMGYGVPYPGSVLPRSVPRLVHAFIHDAGVPGAQLEWHGHNDFHKVLVNASTAWLYGCASANCSLFGIGERTGNPPLEGLIFEYIGLTGHRDGIDTTVITELAEYYKRTVGVELYERYPFVGSQFNVTAAGIHADGVIKNEEIYNIFDTARILRRPLGVNITDKSGIAGVAYWVNQQLVSRGREPLDKRHPALGKIHEWVMEQYERGRNTALSTEEMVQAVRQYLPEYFD